MHHPTHQAGIGVDPLTLAAPSHDDAGSGPLVVPVDPVRGRSVFLPDRAIVVTRQCRTATGWRCGVIARRAPTTQAGHVHVSTAQYEAAARYLLVDRDTDRDVLAMLWQARVWQYGPGSHRWTLGRHLLTAVRTPGTLQLELSRPALTRASHATHLLPGVIRQILANLVMDGFLVVTASDTADLTLVLVLPSEPNP